MSKYHPSTLRTMALQVIAAWQRRDPLYDEFMQCLQQRTGLKRGTCERILTGLAGY